MRKGRIENPSFCFAAVFQAACAIQGYLKIHF
jgi:hypothetical protein